MPRRSKHPRNVVLIVAYDHRGEKLESHQLTIEDYYDGDQPIIDDAGYRRKMKIRKVAGIVYDPDGLVGKQFELLYDRYGRHVSSHTVFQDGTIIDN